MKLLLRNTRWYSPDGEGAGDIRISGGRIRKMARGLARRPGERILELSGYLVVPGLINAHDHLGLNLFPRTGHPPYGNFYEWAKDAYRPDEAVHREIMSVAERDRLLWGAYKNLISGVTTVMHHDPYSRHFSRRDYPVNVIRRYVWDHSLGFGRHTKWKALAARLVGRPIVIHAAEGTDARSAREIDDLRSIGALASRTVLVHAIAVEPRQIGEIARAGSSVVWCPASNYFLFDATAPVAPLLRSGVDVALGTDSMLSGAPSLLDEMRFADSRALVSGEELFRMVTANPARIFGLRDGRGTLREGGRADLAVFPDAGSTPLESIIHNRPTLVLLRGSPRLAREDFAEHLELGPAVCRIDAEPTWLAGHVRMLMRRISEHVRPDILQKNPVWQLLSDAGPAYDRETAPRHRRPPSTEVQSEVQSTATQ